MLSTVISIIIVILGIIGISSLPVEKYPDIAPPTVYVTTTYYGANAETLQKSVVAPLEEAINGVENMIYMSSTCSNSGSVTIKVYFEQGTDPDMAAVNVQNKVSTATSQLPTEVKNVGVTTVKSQSSMLQVFALYSPDDSYDEEFLANYVDRNLKPEIKRITGVGDFVVLGGTYSMRIWMNPVLMAQYKLMPSDVTAALAEQNIESATGSFGENSGETYSYTMRYKGRKVTPEEFGEIVIRSTSDGEVLRLKDVARVELGVVSYSYTGHVDSHPGIACLVFQTSGSNATEVNNKIDAFIEEAKADMPRGVEYVQLTSTNDFLYASIYEVIKTLIEAIILVVIVCYVFLQDIRSTIIPLVGIIVSLVGTFAFMSVAGFSINLITLFALVLVIGTVVDDSVIVVEAVQSKFDKGYLSPYMASRDAMGGISSAIITSSLVFMAVFIPVSFMGGTSGVFYTQFGLTMAAAVGISAINALTLSPALCALLMRPYMDENGEQKNNFSNRFRKSFNAAFETMSEKYKAGAHIFVQHPRTTLCIIAVSLGLLFYLLNTTKTALVPEEDQGVVMVNVTTSPGSSLETTEAVMARLVDRISNISGVKIVERTAGYGLISGASTSAGMLTVTLNDWSERGEGEDVNSIIKKIYGVTADIKDASIFAMAPPMISGYGTGNNLDIQLQDKMGGELTDFYGYAQQFIGALNQRPEISMAYSTFSMNYPMWEVDVDAAQCKRAGVSPSTVLSTLSGYYGGQYVSDFNRFSKIYKVMIQADPKFRNDESTLNSCFVRMNNGEMAPLSQFVKLTKVYSAEVLNRYNMYTSIGVSAMPADGYSSGDGIKAVREVAEQVLPHGYGYEFSGITREEAQQSGSSTAIVFGICFLIIYLLLSALYESYIIPFAVILSVPVGLMGAFVFAKLFGIENNIYLQTALIMLIGLLSKTAILLTEYAAERRRSGMSLVSSALSAAKARLRPVLMTVLTMVLGLLPLVVATGVGANGNRSLGVGAVGGMIIGSIGLLFLVPSLFVIFQWLQERFTPVQAQRSEDYEIRQQKEEEDEERRKYLEQKNKQNSENND